MTTSEQKPVPAKTASRKSPAKKVVAEPVADVEETVAPVEKTVVSRKSATKKISEPAVEAGASPHLRQNLNESGRWPFPTGLRPN